MASSLAVAYFCVLPSPITKAVPTFYSMIFQLFKSNVRFLFLDAGIIAIIYIVIKQ